MWNALTATERDKIDWLMRAMAVAGHWCFDDDNDFKTGLRNDGGFRKTFNPNFREPYVGVVLAASLYFGANALNSAFTNFNYDTYLAAFTNHGFSNVLNAWQTFVTNTPAHTWKALLENGGTDDYGGTGAGVRSAFTYQGVPLTNPMGIFRKLTEYTYGPPVIDGLGTNSFTLNGGSSPYLGQKGMLLEFNAADGNGPRSDANYAWLGWNCNLTTAATLMALGLWQNGYDNAVVQNLMEVGSEDLLYKLSAGFHSFALGVFSTNYTDATQNPKGYNFDRDLWRTERLLFALNQTIQGDWPAVLHQSYFK